MVSVVHCLENYCKVNKNVRGYQSDLVAFFYFCCKLMLVCYNKTINGGCVMKDLISNARGIHASFFFNDDAVLSNRKVINAVYEAFGGIFPDEPIVLPQNDKQPKDLPVFIYNKNNGGTNLTITSDRISFNSGVVDGNLAIENLRLISKLMCNVCFGSDILIKRIGLVIQTSTDADLGNILKSKVSGIESYSRAVDKSIVWNIEKKIDNNISLNINTNISQGLNIKNEGKDNIIIIDVNTTPASFVINESQQVFSLIDTIIAVLEEKMENVL